MRILIIGAGNAGCQLARRLCEDRHNVVMIDRNVDALRRAETGLDILTVCGSGASPRILDEVQVDKSDLVIAVTDCDEVNIVACLFAHSTGVARTVARVSDPDFIRRHDAYDLQTMGISLVINQKQECAREIASMLEMPGAREVFRLFDDRLMVAGLPVHTDNPLLGHSPMDCGRADLMAAIRLLAVRREGGMIIPHGDTVFKPSDFVYLVGQPPAVSATLNWMRPDIRAFEKVIIAGGGDIGLLLARMLEHRLPCVVLEKDDQQARHCSAELSKTLILRADALSESTLDEAGMTGNCAFVALTGDDEANIMNCLMAQKQGAGITIAQITRPDYMPVLKQLGLVDRIVNPYLSMTRGILHYLRSQHIQAASLLHNLPGELLDVTIVPDSRADGVLLRDLKLPRAAIVAAVLRDGDVQTPTGDLQFVTGDRALVFAHPDAIRKIESLFLK